jgi:single-strand selective monofunctional uracil DNA glycosylase
MTPATAIPDGILAATDDFVVRIGALAFSDPVTHIYNPLIYARSGYDRYVSRYGGSTRAVVFVGMNPGPFGMVQTGVPFGDVEMVKDWMGIEADVGQPAVVHPKRPVSGFACSRGEVSGRRLWGWAKKRFGAPEIFFRRFFVLNYCPLAFMEASGRNRTPDKLPAVEKKRLFEVCDKALRQSIALFRPQRVVGIGAFAEARARKALSGLKLTVGRITHPSPANPRANRGWEQRIESELEAMGVDLTKISKA